MKTKLSIDPISPKTAEFKTQDSLSTFLGSGFISANFNDEEGSDNVLAKQALVAVEGSYKDSGGREHVFTTERLNTIAGYTNKALDTGNIIPLCADHEKKVSSTIGSVDGNAYVKVIGIEDLPNKKATHLIGKNGLFFSDVKVKDFDAATKVRNGIVTSVSMGLNLDPNDHRIVELSLVPIPAIPNMGLFGLLSGVKDIVSFNSLGSADSINNNIFSWEDREKNDQTLDDLKEEYENLSEALWEILQNIYSSENSDIGDVTTLKQYVYNALNGFSIRVVDVLGLSQVEEEGDPTANAETMSAEQTAQQSMSQQADAVSPSQASMGLGVGKLIAAFSKKQTAEFSASSGLLAYAKYNKVSKYLK